MSTDPAVAPRKGMPSPTLDRATFRMRFLNRFCDPAFEAAATELDRIEAIAWGAYNEGRKSPLTRKAGPAFHDPDYDLSQDWLAARDAVEAA